MFDDLKTRIENKRLFRVINFDEAYQKYKEYELNIQELQRLGAQPKSRETKLDCKYEELIFESASFYQRFSLEETSILLEAFCREFIIDTKNKNEPNEPNDTN